LITLRQVAIYYRLLKVSIWKEKAGRDISIRCFRSVLQSRAHFIETFGQGRFLVLLNEQCQASAALLSVYASLLALLVTFAAYGSLVVVTAPLASLLALAIVGGVAVSLNYFVREAGELGHRAVAAREHFSNLAAERYRGWRVIKLASTLGRETAVLKASADVIFGNRVDMTRNSGAIMLLVGPTMTAIALLCLYIAVEYLSVTISVITLFVVVLLRLIPVSQSLTSQRQSIANFGAALSRVQETLRACERRKEVDTGVRSFEGLRRGITFENVTFRYEDEEQEALVAASATIPANRVTAIIGASGSGKSTLVSLIPRLETALSGTVSVDGVPVGEFRLESLRRQIAFVSQSPFLFKASVRDNLRYFNLQAADADIVQACRLAHAEGFIRAMPQGYDTMLGEDGQRLSGGERQRLVLARALLADAKILVLDEPTSALDFESEREVQAALVDIVARGGMTIIVIAHRLSTIKGADHLIVLDSGRVVQSGAPNTMQEDDSWYRRMIDAQAAAI
jgi:ABC-type multidrug transport system fused ATPase/permease subunit